MTSICVIANPAASVGNASTLADQAVAAALAAGHDVTRVLPPGASGTTAALRHAVSTGVQRVIVIGGDGTVNLAVNVLAETGVELGIVAGGTGNDSARALGLPFDDPTTAIAAALSPAVAVDGLRTNHGWVMTVATVGFSVAVNKRANRLRFPRGAALYRRATIEELPRLRTLPMTLTVDGIVHPVEATMLAVANGAYFGGGMQICPAATVHDGLLDVTVIGEVSRFELLRVLPKVFKGAHIGHKAVTTYRGTEVHLAGHAELWADGEPMGPLPVTLRAVPNALLIAGAAR